MKKSVWVLAGLLFANFAMGATAPACLKEVVGQKSCIAGDTMQCNKKFDPKIKDFRYVWEGINASGQSFDVDNQLYKKIPGFTPVACADSNAKTASR